MIHRRSLLRGLWAMPAIVLADHLMPIRGLVMPLATSVLKLVDVNGDVVQTLPLERQWLTTLYHDVCAVQHPVPITAIEVHDAGMVQRILRVDQVIGLPSPNRYREFNR